jgi:hypothetical protein
MQLLERGDDGDQPIKICSRIKLYFRQKFASSSQQKSRNYCEKLEDPKK